MKSVAAIALGYLTVAAWSQNDSELTPRQLFLVTVPAPVAPKPAPKKGSGTSVKPIPPPVTPPSPGAGATSKPDPTPTPVPIVHAAYTPAPLVLKYSILQKKGTNFEEVDSDTQFHSGDRIRVRVEANTSAYLYIVMGGSSGQWRVLFPSKDIAGGDNRIEAGASCSIPPDTDPPFYFDETAGVEKVSLVLSRSPEPDLEKLIYAVGDPTRNIEQQDKTIMAMNKPIDGSVVNQLRDQVLSRDLVFEKYDGTAPDGKQEKAVYAATKDKTPNARLFVDLKLVHK